jgi:Immunity protein 21
MADGKISARNEAMANARKWIDTTGGPHVLLAEELLSHWRGVEGAFDHRDPHDLSDYARACRVTSWLGTITCGTAIALVLSGDAGPIAWIPNASGRGGVLVQWIGVDDEQRIDIVLQSEELASLLASPDVETVDFDVGATGRMRLFDSADSGNDMIGDSQELRLSPGRYRMRAAYYESPELMIVVRDISPP